MNTSILNLLKQICIQVKFFNRKDGSAIPKFIEDRHISIQTLISAMFDFGEGGIFKLLLFDYLGKLPHTVESDQPSCLLSAGLTNFIIEMSEDREGFMFTYNKLFHRLMAANFDIICKLLLNFFLVRSDQKAAIGNQFN